MRTSFLLVGILSLAACGCQTTKKETVTGDAKMLQTAPAPEIHGEVGATYSHTSGSH